MSENFTTISSNLVSISPLYEDETPELWQTWLFGLLIITAASLLPPTAILIIPLLSKSLYDRCMIFLVALGIGAMSGSCIFILIPQAFNVSEMQRFEYITKSWLMISALYLFFIVDRVLQCIIEFRRRRSNRYKVHASTLKSLINKSKKKQPKQHQNKNAHLVNGFSKQHFDAPHIVDKEKHQLETNESLRKKSPLHHQHSLTIDDDGIIVNNNNNNNYENSINDNNTNIEKKTHNNKIVYGHKNNNNHNSDHHHYIQHQHHPNHKKLKSKNSKEKAELEMRTDAECQNLEDEVELSMINNTLARTFSTRRSFVVLKQEKPESIQYESEDGSIHSISKMVDDICGMNVNDLTNKTHLQSEKSSKTINDKEVVVSIDVHDKMVLNKARLEIASVAYMILFGSSANNFVDGMSTGAAFSDSIVRGATIGLAVLSQQFPQELGTLAILINSGLGVRRTIMFNMIPITLSYIGFAFGVFLDNVNDSYDSFIFSISAGMYFYIFLGTVIPEIRESFNETLKTNVWEAALCTILQFTGIAFGVGFLFLMN